MNKYFTRILFLVAFIVSAVTVSAQPRMKKADKRSSRIERVKLERNPQRKKALRKEVEIAPVEFKSNNLKIADYRPSYGEMLFWANDDKDNCFKLYVASDVCDGVFSSDAIEADYSYFICGGDTALYTSGEITVSTDEMGNTSLKGEITGISYGGEVMAMNIDCKTIEITPSRVENYEVENAKFCDDRETYGYYGLDCTVNDSILFYFYSYETPLEGKFNEWNVDVDYSIIMFDKDLDLRFYDIVKANYEISKTENEGEYKFIGSFILVNEDDSADCPQYNFSFTFLENPPLDYDVDDRDFSASFSGDEISFDDSYAEDGYYYIECLKDDNKYAFLEFILSEGDPKTFVPEGTYEICKDDWYSMDFLVASEGVDEDDDISGSFVGEIDEDGYISADGLWMITSGTVTVSNNGETVTMVLAGKNSCDRDVNITLTYPLIEEKVKGDGIIANGEFEEWLSDDTPKGWTGWQITEKGNTGGASLEKTADCHDGEYACLIKGDTKNKRLATDKIALDAGTYIVEFYAKSVGESGTIKPGYAHSDGKGGVIYEYGDYAEEGVSLTPSWQKVTFEFTLEETTEVSMLIMNYKNSGDCIIDSYNVYGTYPDAIASAKSDSKSAKALFNLQGMRVGSDYKGIVISGGKKYIKK